MPEPMSPAAALRLALTTYLPDGYRDEDGAWHDGPVLRDALAALDALLAENAEFHRALAKVALPETASVDDLIRHHRNNVYLAVTFDQIAERELGRRRIAQLTEAGDSLAAVAAQFMDTGRGDLDGCLLSWADIASAGHRWQEKKP